MNRLDNDIWSVLSRKIARESNEEDDIILDQWLLDGQNREIYNTILRIRHDCDFEPAMASRELVLEDVMGKIYSSNNSAQTGNKRFRLLVATFAAAIIILIGLGGLLWHYTSTKYEHPVEFTCSTGISKITLPDNTKVTLNQGSTISYFADFNKKNRKVSLKGEAFFDVTHNPDKRFIVSTESIDIQVLGTSFNISAYPEKAEVTTDLYTGSLEMKEIGTNKTVRLKPGEAGTYNKKTARMTTKEFDRSSTATWMREDIVFKGTPFNEVCEILENSFGITIKVQNKNFKNKAFTGRFVDKESIEEILAVIQISVPINYTIQDNTVIIK